MSDCREPCEHRMFGRCPGCGMELWAPSVWAFSHGEAACQCGFKVPSPQETP